MKRTPIAVDVAKSVFELAVSTAPALRTRTARINALRGHLREFGCVIPLGARHVGTPHRLRSGRDVAAYPGLTPREHSSGSGRRLGAITKRGNTYVRMLHVHGARKGHNVAAVALANKLARVCWRVWRDERPFARREVAE